ncbi:MAG TPA: cytochrome c3 family protein [Ignavibacteriaceae bacterium]|nr:cytochrome c3 family protein [Ignavibacteriaceae bacterium]
MLDQILRIRLPITLFVVIASFSITYFASRAERDGIGYAPEQPIVFSHKLHAGDMSIDCQYCHTAVEKSRHATIPAVATCMNCHTVARKDRPEIIKLTKYYNEGKALEWNRIHKIPDFAYFNHSVHVNRGIDCIHCHGDVKKMEIVGQMNSFTMAACLNCHKNAHENLPELKEVNNGPTNCFACHR